MLFSLWRYIVIAKLDWRWVIYRMNVSPLFAARKLIGSRNGMKFTYPLGIALDRALELRH